MKLYLNKAVSFKSKDNFSCVYHNITGWYYPAKTDFWKTLQSYKVGKEVDPEKIPPALSELISNRFLIKKKTRGKNEFLDFYPTRYPETVYYQGDEGIDVAVERRGAHDEIDFDVLTLHGVAAETWNLSDGTKTVKEIIDELNRDKETIFETFKEWASIENQIMKLLSIPLTEFRNLPPQLIYKAPFLTRKALPKKSADDVHKYHLETIKDGSEQFEKIESTLSHIYRIPHPILRNQSYGQAFYKKIKEIKEIVSDLRILEVGGGMGSISSEILSELKKEKKDAEYVVYDLSPALIKSQRKQHKDAGVRANHIHGNGEILALKDQSIDIALSNEAIADFNTPEVTTKDVKEFLFDHEIPMTEEFFHWYRGAPEKVRVNLGAFQLLKELYRVLRPGGLAIVTEFGYQERLPFKASHLDHAEYSIQFGQAISVATDAFDFMGFRSDLKLMTHFSFQAVSRILEHHNKNLPNISYTEDLFKKQLGGAADKFRGISFVEISKDPFKVVKVLVCEKGDPKKQPEEAG
jgi:ubiquinone/menaquinone biosynthesis C-methylase UbiE